MDQKFSFKQVLASRRFEHTAIIRRQGLKKNFFLIRRQGSIIDYLFVDQDLPV